MTGPATDDFSGYVLCGGASRRMGRDKALIEIDGLPLARRVADALGSAGAAEVYAVGGDAPRLSGHGLTVLDDRWPGEGPLGGIVTALGHVGPWGRAVVLSCDLLEPDPASIRKVVECRDRHDADLVVPVVDGRRQWLHGAWAGRCAAILGDVFAAGERSVEAGAAGLRTSFLAGLPTGTGRDADDPADLPGGGIADVR